MALDPDEIVNKFSEILATEEGVSPALKSNVTECFAVVSRIYFAVPRFEMEFDESVFDHAGDLWKLMKEQLSETLFMQDSSQAQRSLLAAEPGLGVAFKLIFKYLDRPESIVDSSSTGGQDEDGVDSIFQKKMDPVLFSAVVDEALRERYDLAKMTLVFLAFCVQFKWRLKLPAKVWSFVEQQAVPRLSGLLQFYALLRWFCARPVDSKTSRYHFGSRGVGKDKHLMDHFIDHRAGRKIRQHWRRHAKTDGVNSARYRAMADLTIDALWPADNFISLLEFLVLTEQYHCLLELCDRLDPSREDLKFCRVFAQGLASLHLDDPKQALEKFRMAFEGVERGDRLLIEHLSLTPQNEKVDYFRKVAESYEKKGLSKYVIEVCEDIIRITAVEGATMLPILTTMFKHYSILQRYDDAFSVIGKLHFDQIAQHNCLKEFVCRLQDQDALGKLQDYDFGDLEREMLSIIESRARTIDITVENYYEFLYAFCLSRSNYQKAAAFLYEMVMRFRKEAVDLATLRRQVEALAACLNTLAIGGDTWLEVPVAKADSLLEHAGSSPKRASDGVEKETVSMVSPGRINAKEIQCQYILAKSSLALTEQKGSHVGVLSPKEAVKFLLHYNLFDLAVDVCVLHEMPLVDIIDSLSLRCVQSDKPRATAGVDQDKWMALLENNSIYSRVGDSKSQGYAWSMLQAYLERLSPIVPPSPLYATAVRRFLSLSHAIPEWLTAQFKQIDFPELLRLMIEYDRLAEAQRLLCLYLDAALGIGPEDFNLKETLTIGKRSPVWLPVSSIDLLLTLLAEKHSDADCTKLRDELEEKIKRYFNQLNLQMEMARKK